MLEKPELNEAQISKCVRYSYGVDIYQVVFLPIGYDPNTAVYRVQARDGQSYFLKLRKEHFDPVTVILPQFLHNQNINTIIPPLPTRHGELYGKLDQYATILYPFIIGKDGYEVRLTDDHWIELGRTLRCVHEAQVSKDLIAQIPRETYDPQWRESVRGFLAQIVQVAYEDPIASRFAAFLQSNRKIIERILERADILAGSLKDQNTKFSLCHNDAHPGNYLITDTGELYLVDWDTPIFAPKERDLMYFGTGMSGDQPGGREECLFYQGYGSVTINQTALAYYRFERIIQDAAEFCTRILLSKDGGEDRAQSYKYFTDSFQPGRVVDAAFKTDLTGSNIDLRSRNAVSG